jgi:cytochrome P450
MKPDLLNQLKNEAPRAELIQMNQLPGPAGLPLLGNALQLNPEKLHRIFEKWSDRYGPIFRIQLGTIPVVVVSAPETIQEVLKNRPEKFRRLEKMDNIIREMGVYGVFNAEGEDWKKQRRLVSQALNLQHLKSFFPTLVGITKKLKQRWLSLAAEQASVDVKSELMRLTVDVTSQLAFGYNMNTIEKKEDLIQEHLEVIFPAIFKRIHYPFPYWRYFKLPADKKLDRSLKFIHQFLQEIIDETRTQMEQQPELQVRPTNFLQAVIAASGKEDPVSNQVISGNVITMLMAGEDTTSNTLAWIFYFMHLNPGVQEKMQQEVDVILGENDSLDSYDNASRLTYLEAVAFEAMRIKPVSPLLFLNALQDLVLEGVLIPSGTGVFVQMYYAANKAAYFSEPEKFIPERWITGGCPFHQKHEEKAFTPFGGGPRYCPGYNLAMLEIKTVLAMVCKNFTVVMETPPENVREILAFTLMPNSFLIKLERRN